jgi:hypothetical protein
VLAIVAVAEGVFRLAAVISTEDPIGSMLLAFLSFRLKSEVPQYVPSDEILEIGGGAECRLARAEGLVGTGRTPRRNLGSDPRVDGRVRFL